MASRLVFDPTTLLRVAPLVSSTAAVWYCFDQWLFFGNFLHRDVRQKTNQFLPAYWNAQLKTGLAAIFSLYGISLATGLTNWFSRSHASLASQLYLAGSCLTAAHFVFVPYVAEEIRAIVRDGNAVQSQTNWMKAHLIRTFTVDVPGWLCFGAAVLQSVQAI